MFRVEIAKAWHRPRTWVFAAGLALLAALPVIVLRGLGASGQGGAFFEEIRHSGLFAALAAVALVSRSSWCSARPCSPESRSPPRRRTGRFATCWSVR